MSPSPTQALAQRAALRHAKAAVRSLAATGVDPRDLTALGDARLELAEQLTRRKRHDDAVVEFAAACDAFVTAGRSARAAQVRVRWASVLMVLGRQDEALPVLDAVIGASGRVEGGAEVLAMAHLWQVVALKELGRDAEALTRARRLVKRFAPGSGDAQRQVVARGLLLESELALAAGDRAGALRAARKIVTGYGARAEAGVEGLVGIVADARRQIEVLSAAPGGPERA